jgi:methylglutaconyl-CoA hydratase
MAEPILLDIDPAGVATITLNRPDIHNAFDDALIAGLTETFLKVGTDPKARAVVLRGAGKSFSAGADIKWMRRMADYSREENARDAEALAGMLKTLNDIPKPTVALVQGAAIGGGVGLAACCDVVIAAEDAVFSLSEVRIGLIPATIGPYVVAAIGARQARRYFLTAERFSAAEALRVGLAHEVVPAADLDSARARFVEALLKNGPKAMGEAKALIRDVAGRPIDRALIKETAERIAHIRASAEGKEGLTAFLEKRAPRWSKP